MLGILNAFSAKLGHTSAMPGMFMSSRPMSGLSVASGPFDEKTSPLGDVTVTFIHGAVPGL